MTPKEFYSSNSICSLPWVGVYVNPDGAIKNCAISKTTLGNLHTKPLEQILTGVTNTLIKKDMLANIQNSRCDACYNIENRAHVDSKNYSNRSWHKKYGVKDVDMSIYDDPSSFDLKVLDLRWNNTCNLACVYCGPDLSSKWANELNDKSYVIDHDVLTQSKQYIFNNLSQISHVYLAGGEPLLIKENLELLNLLYEQNPLVEIRINTNLLATHSEIFKKLILFKNIKWTVSVDSMADEFAYMRYPGNWNKFYENLIDIKNQNFDINFNMVWCILNSESIFHCIDMLQDLGFHDNSFIVQCLEGPLPLDIRHLSIDCIKKLKLIIKQRISKSNPNYWLHKSLTSMYNYIDTPWNNADISLTFEFLKTLDQRRGLNSQLVFPDLYNI